MPVGVIDWKSETTSMDGTSIHSPSREYEFWKFRMGSSHGEDPVGRTGGRFRHDP